MTTRGARMRPNMQHELGRRAFMELVDENMGDPGWRGTIIFNRASDELKQHYFDRHIPAAEQEYLRALIESGPRK